MIGDLALPSDDPPEPARDAGYGDQFRYWRGASGRRYLFSLVPNEALADFRFVVVLLAERSADGRLIGRSLIDVDASGWPGTHGPPEGGISFVHFLAATSEARVHVIEDLVAAPVRLAA